MKPQAVLVGINTYPDAPLRGCVNDVLDAKLYLESLGVPGDRIVLLRDEQATRAAVQSAVKAAFAEANQGAPTVVWFSGHGTTSNGKSALVPWDYQKAGVLTRDDLGLDLLTNLTNTVFVADACHSGTLARATWWRNKSIASDPIRAEMLPERRDNLAYLAACGFQQTAADAAFAGRPNGALSWCFLRRLRSHPDWTLRRVVQQVVVDLHDQHFLQVPALGGQPYCAQVPFAAFGGAP